MSTEKLEINQMKVVIVKCQVLFTSQLKSDQQTQFFASDSSKF